VGLLYWDMRCITLAVLMYLTGPIYDDEALLVADLDLDEIVRAKCDFDVVGHYSRPDIFRLLVNRSARQPTAFNSESGQ
jgi:nitrilase